MKNHEIPKGATHIKFPSMQFLRVDSKGYVLFYWSKEDMWGWCYNGCHIDEYGPNELIKIDTGFSEN